MDASSRMGLFTSPDDIKKEKARRPCPLGWVAGLTLRACLLLGLGLGLGLTPLCFDPPLFWEDE
eukprot:4526809-Alexandrium_andersonii.AAC.1